MKKSSVPHNEVKIATLDVFLCSCGDVSLRKGDSKREVSEKLPELPEIKVNAEVSKLDVKQKKVVNPIFREEEEREPVDWAVVGAVSVIALMFLAVIGVVIFVVVSHNNAQYSRECKSNPTLLYANKCSDEAECLRLCINALKKKG